MTKIIILKIMNLNHLNQNKEELTIEELQTIELDNGLPLNGDENEL
ncbi:hypothetical protein DDB_G0281801 [Dictyostelium discoideum AX4]|nr:hypothetical protein DDB_G0281801 [Dictyostelium discoideum AX4]EAL66662.1 hypothetical protein DDB_G0281801 [Dictyostelium discoideum AX4]|eukprot:XP_640545.1 hypothetical protein DDB_G0281801 [Dictyostelium discoideum AX4]